MEEKYEKYLNIHQLPINEQLNLISEITTQHPKLIDYIISKTDSCYGPHRVYVVKLELNGIDVLKIGYTKNTVKQRFKEIRWKGVETIVVKEIYREEILQALGAKEFESEINSRCEIHKLDNEHVLPGKKEFLKINSLDDVLRIYDTIIPNYRNIVGLKSPN